MFWRGRRSGWQRSWRGATRSSPVGTQLCAELLHALARLFHVQEALLDVGRSAARGRTAPSVAGINGSTCNDSSDALPPTAVLPVEPALSGDVGDTRPGPALTPTDVRGRELGEDSRPFKL